MVFLASGCRFFTSVVELSDAQILLDAIFVREEHGGCTEEIWGGGGGGREEGSTELENESSLTMSWAAPDDGFCTKPLGLSFRSKKPREN